MNNKEISKIMPGLLDQFGIKDKAMQTKLMNPLFDASSKALMGLTTSAVGGMFNAMSTPAQQMGNFGQNYNPIMANGGMMGQVQAEVEGGEVMQTPDGQMEKVQGPRHEQGGVPVEAPEGTMVFSDRIKLEGKTMAQRKELREKKLMKLKKLVDKNPSDKILKNSYERVIEKNAVQEMADIAHQEQVDTHEKSMQAFSNVAQMMMNGGMMTNNQYGNGGQMKKYANGGKISEPPPGYMTDDEMLQMMYSNQSNPMVARMLNPDAPKLDLGNNEHGTHQLGSYGNYVVPRIVEGEDGKLMQLGAGKKNYHDDVLNFSRQTKGANDLKFDSPEKAKYFSENYKNVAPFMQGNFMEGKRKEFANGGTMTNDLPKYAEGGMLADQFDAPTDGPGDPPKTTTTSLGFSTIAKDPKTGHIYYLDRGQHYILDKKTKTFKKTNTPSDKKLQGVSKDKIAIYENAINDLQKKEGLETTKSVDYESYSTPKYFVNKKNKEKFSEVFRLDPDGKFRNFVKNDKGLKLRGSAVSNMNDDDYVEMDSQKALSIFDSKTRDFISNTTSAELDNIRYTTESNNSMSNPVINTQGEKPLIEASTLDGKPLSLSLDNSLPEGYSFMQFIEPGNAVFKNKEGKPVKKDGSEISNEEAVYLGLPAPNPPTFKTKEEEAKALIKLNTDIRSRFTDKGAKSGFKLTDHSSHGYYDFNGKRIYADDSIVAGSDLMFQEHVNKKQNNQPETTLAEEFDKPETTSQPQTSTQANQPQAETSTQAAEPQASQSVTEPVDSASTPQTETGKALAEESQIDQTNAPEGYEIYKIDDDGTEHMRLKVPENIPEGLRFTGYNDDNSENYAYDLSTEPLETIEPEQFNLSESQLANRNAAANMPDDLRKSLDLGEQVPEGFSQVGLDEQGRPRFATSGKLSTEPLETITPGQLSTNESQPPIDGFSMYNDPNYAPPLAPEEDLEPESTEPELSTEMGKQIASTSNGQQGEAGEGYNYTQGDIMGMASTMFGGTMPMLTTLANRAGDKPNVNAYRDFGLNAINNMQAQKGFAGQQLAQSNKELELAQTEQMNSTNQNARSVNTMRTLKAAQFANKNRAQSQLANSYATQMAGVTGQLSQLMNSRDTYYMQGEQARDLADRQDRDNFYSQLGADFQSAGSAGQKLGQDMNKNLYNQNTIAMQAAMSQYGTRPIFDKNGRFLRMEGNAVNIQPAKPKPVKPVEYGMPNSVMANAKTTNPSQDAYNDLMNLFN